MGVLGLNKQGVINSVKYNKWRGWNKWGEHFIYFDPNDVNASKLAYVQIKL